MSFGKAGRRIFSTAIRPAVQFAAKQGARLRALTLRVNKALGACLRTPFQAYMCRRVSGKGRLPAPRLRARIWYMPTPPASKSSAHAAMYSRQTR